MGDVYMVNGKILSGLPNHAKDIEFDNTGTTLSSTNTEDAIKEVNSNLSHVPTFTLYKYPVSGSITGGGDVPQIYISSIFGAKTISDNFYPISAVYFGDFGGAVSCAFGSLPGYSGIWVHLHNNSAVTLNYDGNIYITTIEFI